MLIKMESAGGGGIPHVECGEVTGSGTSSSNLVSANVTFSSPFNNPVVFFRGKETSGDYVGYFAPWVSAGINVNNLSPTGFTVQYGQHYTGQTRNFTVQWVAMEESVIQ